MTSTVTGPLLSWNSGTPLDAPTLVRSMPIDKRPLAEGHSRFLHVAEQGTVVRRAGSRVLVTLKTEKLIEVPAVKLQGVLAYGNVQVSTQCMRVLLDEGVWMSFFSRNGVYQGRLQPPVESGGRLRRRQWECARNPSFSLDFARSVVRGKLLAQRTVAAAYSRNYLAETLGESHQILRDCLDRVAQAADAAELRGVEGTASRAYFQIFRRCNRSSIPFEGREKRGALDPINALLNFGYTLLTRELEGLTEAAGLDPTVGFYHMPDDDRPSLACDWVEEFRHTVVDRLVLNLVNRNSITAADFDEIESKGLRLKPGALRKFITAYERLMIGKPDAEDDDKHPAWRTVFLDQLARLLDALAGRQPYRTHLEP